jgi:non-heme chloroperoxidase
MIKSPPSRLCSLVGKLVKGATVKLIPGAPHGMCSTLKDQINAELLAFF